MRQLEKRLRGSNSAAARGYCVQIALHGTPWLQGRCGMVKTYLGSNQIWQTTPKFLIYGPHIFGMAKARDFKFGVCTDDDE